MSHMRFHDVNRRSFLKHAGLSALAGAAAGAPSPVAAAAEAAFAAPDGRFDFDTPYNRFGTDSTKWDQQIRVWGKDSIVAGMGTADMDFRAAPVITKALADRLQHENWGYLDTGGSAVTTFIESIAAWNKRRHGIDVNPDSVVLTTGVHPGLIAALKTFSPPGSKVLMTTPVYSGFYSDLAYCQVKAEESPMRVVNGRYSIDFEDFERRIDHDTNTFILCNPHNPTGNCWSAEDLARLGEICLRRRVVVLADEIHCDFVTRGSKYTPFASLPDKDVVRNSITFKAASKSFGLAAMKCAWFFSDNMDYIARVKRNNRADLTTLGMIASRAAYAGGEEWLNQCVAYIDGNQDFVESYVRANIPMLKVVKPQGTYLSWLDVTEVAERLGARQLAAAEAGKASGRPVTPEAIVERFFVRNAKVHMLAGSSFGLGGANHMRMNIGTSRRTLEIALRNLAGALRNPSMTSGPGGQARG
jgi:cysteine-S-conjugate beta-lyase